ncbi:MAG: response regulator, partial [Clostridiales Family XIII bacterium]|nr:response regulator [Clostridiales Family XIII bacterium]
ARIENSALAEGRPLIDLFYDSRLKGIVSEALSGDGDYEATQEVEIDGELRWLKIVSAKLKGEQVGSFIDISDVTLIMRAKIEAEEASRYKSDFLSNMSHELRTPMNAIIGMTTIGLEAKTMERKDYCLDKVKGSSSHLLGVINDILDMSKIEANKLELAVNEFNFETMMQQVANLISFRAVNKALNFFVWIDKEIPYALVGDEQRLAQVIMNLLGNAVKFTPEGGTITLSAHLLEKRAGDYKIQIDVIDNGIGIGREQQGKLFEAFAQADVKIGRKYGGTGLGLALSKRIVELMNGRVWVESVEGEGSTFSFTFDVKKKIGHTTASEMPKLNPALRGKQILIVDSDITRRDYATYLFDSEELNYITTATAGEALAQIKIHDSFDICFIEHKPPQIDGIDLATNMKHTGGAEHVFFIESVRDWSMMESTATEIGVEGFIPIPVFYSALINLLNDIYVEKNPVSAKQLVGGEGALSGRTLLVAEDIDLNREIVQALLESTKVAIDFAENGVIAVEKFSAAPDRYDAILMDIQMPEMDGIEATRCIRALDTAQAKKIPIIAMTANVFKEDIDACIDAGMNGHVGKPLDFADLLSKLQKYLNKPIQPPLRL